MSIIGAAQQQDRNRIAAAYTAIGDPDVVAIYDASSASYITSNAGTDVDVLNDISGNGHHAVASSATNKMQFDSANGWIKSAATTGKSGLTTPSITAGRMLVITQCGGGTDTTWGGQQYIMTGNYGGFGRIRVGVTANFVQISGTGTSDYELCRKNGSTGASSPYQLPLPMGLLTLTANASVSPITQVNTIACSVTDDNRSYTHPIKMAIYTTGSEDTTKLQKIQGWMMHRFGMQSTLVSGHPWRVDAP